MMVSKIITAAITGLEAALVEVEADVSNGLPRTTIVGLPGTAVQESRERVRSAIKHSGCGYPFTRVAVNLAPADAHKAGTHFDLPIALAILLASGQINFAPEQKLFAGELSLDGSLRSVPGVLAMALAARDRGIAEIYVPQANAREAGLVQNLAVYPVADLASLLAHLSGQNAMAVAAPARAAAALPSNQPLADFQDIAGQELAKRALEIASAGGHNLLLHGPPGSGKTLLARALPGILPDLSMGEVLELTKIYSIAGKLSENLIAARPVRQPHHTSSALAIIGGGNAPRPGEITLAHRGVLFLDELPEFPRAILEALRQPLEDGVVTVARAKISLTFPAEFILVGAMNPCPCGYFGDDPGRCTCTAAQVKNYQKKISGPLLDRIDLHVQVPRLPYEKIMGAGAAEASAAVKSRVETARTRQSQRLSGTRTNCRMTNAEVRKFCLLDRAGHELLRQATAHYRLSGRGVHRVLKVSRTIADLAGAADLTASHIAEALQYRSVV